MRAPARGPGAELEAAVHSEAIRQEGRPQKSLTRRTRRSSVSLMLHATPGSDPGRQFTHRGQTPVAHVHTRPTSGAPAAAERAAAPGAQAPAAPCRPV